MRVTMEGEIPTKRYTFKRAYIQRNIYMKRYIYKEKT